MIPIIHEKFENKEQFLSSLHGSLGLNVSKNNSYEKLIKIVIKNNQEKEFSQKLFSSNSFNETIKEHSVRKATDFFTKDEHL